jgi:large subunit ribosomal protein L4
MPVVEVVNLEGQRVGTVELADAVFAVRPNPHLLHEAVRWYLNWQRAGTHKTKGRGEVRGSGRKLWRQKGTGRARVGSIRSPLWRKGGTVHGPQPRSYRYRLPRKVFLGALRSALSAKLAEDQLTVVESFALESHKTKPFRQALDRINGAARTILLVEQGENRNLELASRNLVGVRLVAPQHLQPYDLLRHDRLILSRSAALQLSRSLAPAATTAPQPEVSEPASATEASPTRRAASKAKATRSAKRTEKD